MHTMTPRITKADLERQLAEAQAQIDALAKQAAEKQVVVTARIPQALREDMKAAAMKRGESLQAFMLAAFKTRLQDTNDD